MMQELGMVLIPPGKFMMGSPASEPGRLTGDTQHEVTITKRIYMGKYEVTQEQGRAVMGNIQSNNNTPSTKDGAKFPLKNVSWEECQEFINKLNDKTKGGYRLPTEAEWEYACRAGTTTAYSFGDKITSKDAHYGGGTGTKAVGSYKANAFGLYDMHGNVCEWCEDWYGDYSIASVRDPKGAATGEGRVFRGGSVGDNESFALSSKRDFLAPYKRDELLGFRLARTK